MMINGLHCSVLQAYLIYVMLTVNRLEKDRKFSYFWVRCTKLICVSTKLTFRLFQLKLPRNYTKMKI